MKDTKKDKQQNRNNYTTLITRPIIGDYDL